MKNVLNLNKRIEDRKIETFKKLATKAAKEIDVILGKYEIKIIPFIQPTAIAQGSPLIASLTAGFTFAPLSEIEIEAKKIMLKKDAKKDTKAGN